MNADRPRFVAAVPNLEVHVVDAGPGTSILHLRGEADLATVALLEEGLHHAVASRPARLVVDVSQLRFMDCTAIGALACSRRRLPGVVMLFRGPGPLLTRVLTLVGWADDIEPPTSSGPADGPLPGAPRRLAS